MVLLLDSTNARTRVGLIGARDASWRSAPGPRAMACALAAARRSGAFSGRGASCVVAALSAPGASRDVSWSGVRAAVASANALAFAWGVSAATVFLTGAETDAEAAALVRAAARSAKGKARASYSGEPNITAPKAATKPA
jgi:hypothetical protein